MSLVQALATGVALRVGTEARSEPHQDGQLLSVFAVYQDDDADTGLWAVERGSRRN